MTTQITWKNRHDAQTLEEVRAAVQDKFNTAPEGMLSCYDNHSFPVVWEYIQCKGFSDEINLKDMLAVERKKYLINLGGPDAATDEIGWDCYSGEDLKKLIQENREKAEEDWESFVTDKVDESTVDDYFECLWQPSHMQQC